MSALARAGRLARASALVVAAAALVAGVTLAGGHAVASQAVFTATKTATGTAGTGTWCASSPNGTFTAVSNKQGSNTTWTFTAAAQPGGCTPTYGWTRARYANATNCSGTLSGTQTSSGSTLSINQSGRCYKVQLTVTNNAPPPLASSASSSGNYKFP